MQQKHARFAVGQLIHHRLFDYRGVIADVDPDFQGSEAWYQRVARSRPPKDEPWYHVLVHDTDRETYVAERNLEPDPSGDAVRHPGVDELFSDFRDGVYVRAGQAN